jgi:L-fuculose-phosphate aldolase
VHKTCGALTMASYALPGSDELGENIGKEFDKGFNTVILENHGVCIGAKTLFEALMKFETLEYSASLEILASKIGTPRRLTEEEIHRTQTKDHLMMDDFIPRLCTTEERAARRDMIKFIHRSYRQGLFSATHGTYSVKLSDGSFLITPFGKDRAYLSEEDLVRIKSGMKEQNKIPSRAVKFFEAVYKHNPDIGAILLAHPLHVMAFAVTDASFDAHTIPESYILLREIKKQPMDGVYFNQDEAAKQFCNRVPAIIYNNECVVVTGKDLVQAFDRLEVAEATAYSIISARDAGPIQHITEEEAKALKRAFKLED